MPDQAPSQEPSAAKTIRREAAKPRAAEVASRHDQVLRLQRVIGGSQSDSLLWAAAGRSGLSPGQVASNAAVLLFGGIETTEGMIANALLMLLERPGALGEGFLQQLEVFEVGARYALAVEFLLVALSGEVGG